MELRNVSNEFIEWLNECPVQWFLDKQEDKSLSYTFMKEVENENN